MKTKITFILFIFLSQICFSQTDSENKLSLDFIPYCNDKNEPIDKPIEMDWVQTDIDIIKNKINNIPKYGLTINKLTELIPHFIDGKCNCQSVTYDLGYALKSTQHTIHGGYGSYNVDALYSNNSILKIRLTISNHKEIIENYLIENIELPFACLNGMPTYEIINHDNIKTYTKKNGRIFIESNDTNSKRQNAINYFTDIYNGGVFEKPNYITFGLGSETFNNLRYFIVNKDYFALEDLLYSPSPTSRLFAARTLIYVKEKQDYEPTKEIKNRTKEIISNSEPIKSGIISCWVNKFDYDYFDIVKDYEKLLKTE
jgi:hypothetical protein